MDHHRKDLGAVIIERWGQSPRVIPDFGYHRRKEDCVSRLRDLMTECAPVAVGIALIFVLERIDLTSGHQKVVRHSVPDRQMVAVQEPGPAAGATLQRSPLSR